MNAEELRTVQAPIKARYRDEPSAALRTLRVVGRLDPGAQTCVIETGHPSTVVAGLHEAAGGNGVEACSADMLLQSLAACAGVTLGAVATAMGLNVTGGTVAAEGDLDFRGTLGVDKATPVGFLGVRLHFELDAPGVDGDAVANLLRLTERYCVVFQTLKRPPEVTASASGHS